MAADVWSFPTGVLEADASVKGYEVAASDGPAGKVAWATYAPGESYLVVTLRHHLKPVHHVVAASAVRAVDAGKKVVRLELTRAQIESLPEHHDPAAPPSTNILDAWNRGVADSQWRL